MVFPYKICLRAEWITVILHVVGRLPAMDNRRHKSSPEPKQAGNAGPYKREGGP